MQPPKPPSNKVYAALTIMAASLVLSGVFLFYIAYRGMRALRAGATHAAAVMIGDASIPPAKTAYVGEWKGPHTTLTIDASSHAEWLHQDGHTKESYQNALLTFDGSDLVLDIIVTKKHLKVTAPPHLDGSDWVMTVDGERLVRESP